MWKEIKIKVAARKFDQTTIMVYGGGQRRKEINENEEKIKKDEWKSKRKSVASDERLAYEVAKLIDRSPRGCHQPWCRMGVRDGEMATVRRGCWLWKLTVAQGVQRLKSACLQAPCVHFWPVSIVCRKWMAATDSFCIVFCGPHLRHRNGTEWRKN